MQQCQLRAERLRKSHGSFQGGIIYTTTFNRK
jgi:hypothetical protein